MRSWLALIFSLAITMSAVIADDGESKPKSPDKNKKNATVKKEAKPTIGNDNEAAEAVAETADKPAFNDEYLNYLHKNLENAEEGLVEAQNKKYKNRTKNLQKKIANLKGKIERREKELVEKQKSEEQAAQRLAEAKEQEKKIKEARKQKKK